MVNRTLLYISFVFVIFVIGSVAALAGTQIKGAGATFPYPLYSKWFKIYEDNFGTKIDYQAIGSGGGIKSIEDGSVDFGASDAPVKATERYQNHLKMIPMVAGGVALIYNLSGVKELNLPSEVVSGIYQGKITMWDDPDIKAANPGVNLPKQRIFVTHRSDGSGTTAIFTHFLKTDIKWGHMVGEGTTIRWPLGLPAKGSDGMVELVNSKPGAIGYVDFAHAYKHKLNVANIGNQHGKFIAPSVESIKAAMANFKVGDDYDAYITNEPGDKAYPISGFTFLLVRDDGDKNSHILKFVEWAYSNGDASAVELQYVPLSAELKLSVLTKLKSSQQVSLVY